MDSFNGCHLVIPAHGMEEALVRKVAGLTLIDRLWRTAMRAGMSGVTVIAGKAEMLRDACEQVNAVTEERDLAHVRHERCVVLKPGYLPDTDFLTDVCRQTLPGRQYIVSGHPVIFICSPVHFAYVSTFFLRDNSFGEALRETSRSPGVEEISVARGTIFNVTHPSDIPGVEDRLFKGLVKDTEGFMSRYVERPVSLAISRRLVNANITPNQMSIFSIAVGLAGAALISIGTHPMQVAGALLFLAHSILDGCDGEIARIKFMESRIGGLMDFWGDNIVHSAVFYAIGHAWHTASGNVLPLVLGWTAVISTMGSAGLVYFRTMRTKSADQGPMYTSVAETDTDSRIVKTADFLSRRDFIYLVVILAIFDHLDWFLVLTAIGSPAFFVTLLWLHFKKDRGAGS